MSKKPPSVLDCARVIEYAIVNDSVIYEERETFFVGGELLGEVPKLAICQNLGELEYLLFHCDKHWNVLGAVGYQSIDETKRKIELSYHGITREWEYLGTTEKELKEILKNDLVDDACSFCKKIPILEVDKILRDADTDVKICNVCIDNFYKIIHEDE